MSEFVYILCTITSLLCAVALLKDYFRTGARLLLWSGICFALLTLSNALVYLDKVVLPMVDLSAPRAVVFLAGLGILLFGLIWEAAS